MSKEQIRDKYLALHEITEGELDKLEENFKKSFPNVLTNRTELKFATQAATTSQKEVELYLLYGIKPKDDRAEEEDKNPTEKLMKYMS